MCFCLELEKFFPELAEIGCERGVGRYAGWESGGKEVVVGLGGDGFALGWLGFGGRGGLLILSIGSGR